MCKNGRISKIPSPNDLDTSQRAPMAGFGHIAEKLVRRGEADLRPAFGRCVLRCTRAWRLERRLSAVVLCALCTGVLDGTGPPADRDDGHCFGGPRSVAIASGAAFWWLENQACNLTPDRVDDWVGVSCLYRLSRACNRLCVLLYTLYYLGDVIDHVLCCVYWNICTEFPWIMTVVWMCWWDILLNYWRLTASCT
jgi:hypothetical protein